MRAPKSFRLHIGIFGRRNAGRIIHPECPDQPGSIDRIRDCGNNHRSGRKTDGTASARPVLFIDTAGIDDSGSLGEKRIQKTMGVFDRTDLGLIVSNYNEWGDFEEMILKELNDRGIPMIVVFNKSDLVQTGKCLEKSFSGEKIPVVENFCHNRAGILDLRQAILNHAPEDFINRPGIVADLVGPGEMTILVVPIDKEAPKGRLILPQVQTIRDLLDNDSFCMVVKERELREAFNRLNKPPKLVVTDSQGFSESGSRHTHGNTNNKFFYSVRTISGRPFRKWVKGAMVIDKLKAGDKVLIAEACSHHPIGEDIGTVKIPRWLTQYVGGKVGICAPPRPRFPGEFIGV